MTAITIDKDQAIELLEKQVAEKGTDYVYPFADCEYFAPRTALSNADYSGTIDVEVGASLCILGHVYADLGLGLGDLRMEIQEFNDYDEPLDEVRYEVTDNGALIGDDVVPDPEKVILTPGARLVLGTAQTEQDRRKSWGYALHTAKEAAIDAAD